MNILFFEDHFSILVPPHRRSAGAMVLSASIMGHSSPLFKCRNDCPTNQSGEISSKIHLFLIPLLAQGNEHHVFIWLLMSRLHLSPLHRCLVWPG